MIHNKLRKKLTLGKTLPIALSIFVGAALCHPVVAEDWPTYRHDNRRSGVTSEQLALPLIHSWTYASPTLPQTAWTGPAKWDAYAGLTDLQSMRNFDPVFYTTLVGDVLYFGSSVNDAAYCLDAETGRVRWTFCTDGPVRLPPAWHEDKVYFGSDDGYAYCLDAKTGELIWKYHAAPEDRLIPCNGKLISLWPCRTGVLIKNAKAYFAASLVPWQTSYLCSLNAGTGEVFYKLSHEKATMQGAILASDEHIYVPQGRDPPAIFNRTDGQFLGVMGGGGGSFALLTTDAHLIHGPGNHAGWLTESAGPSRDHLVTFTGAYRMVVAGPTAYLYAQNQLAAFDRGRYLALRESIKELSTRQGQINEKLEELGKDADTDETKKLKAENVRIHSGLKQANDDLPKCYRWRIDCPTLQSLIVARDMLLTGGSGQVTAYDTANGSKIWHERIAGTVHGLTVANGLLLVSTESGKILCFKQD